jgi:hypothetical protein
MKTIHDHYEAVVQEILKARIEIYNLQNKQLELIQESLELKLTNTELELKLAKYELEISRKGV